MTQKEKQTIKDVIAELEFIKAYNRRVEHAKLMLKILIGEGTLAQPIEPGINPIPLPKDPIKTDK